MEQTSVIEGAAGEYVPLPDTKNHVLRGPCRLRLTRKGDGRLVGEILAGHTIRTEVALRHKLRRKGWDL